MSEILSLRLYLHFYYNLVQDEDTLASQASHIDSGYPKLTRATDSDWQY